MREGDASQASFSLLGMWVWGKSSKEIRRARAAQEKGEMMAEAAQESRGWEAKADFHPHVLDDPDYDFARAEMEGGGWSSLWLIIVVIIAALLWHGMALYLPTAVITYQAREQGWAGTCLKIDQQRRYVRPNWEEPSCNAANAKKLGWY